MNRRAHGDGDLQRFQPSTGRRHSAAIRVPSLPASCRATSIIPRHDEVVHVVGNDVADQKGRWVIASVLDSALSARHLAGGEGTVSGAPDPPGSRSCGPLFQALCLFPDDLPTVRVARWAERVIHHGLDR